MVSGLGFRVRSLGVIIQGFTMLRSGVKGLRFKVWGCGVGG
jgi:hypothetical protein